MSDEIIKVLEYLSEKVGLAIDWTSEKIASDIMPYLHEVYHRCVIWGIVQKSCRRICGCGVNRVCHSDTAEVAESIQRGRWYYAV